MGDERSGGGRRVGILGGSFNPPHRGHLAMAGAAREALGLDGVVLVPAARPPHKPNDPDLAAPEDRLAMTRAAAAEAGLEVSDLELRRAGPSYTIDTIEALERERPGDVFFFIIGGDSVGELPSWKDARRLLERVAFVVIGRPGYDLEAGLATVARELGPELAAGLRSRIIDMEPQPVSSTRVRAAVARGEPGWEGLVPRPVADYIRARGLYGGPQ